MDRRPPFEPEAALARHFARELRELRGGEWDSGEGRPRLEPAAPRRALLFPLAAIVSAGLVAAAVGAATRGEALPGGPSRIEAASLERLGTELAKVAALMPGAFRPGLPAAGNQPSQGVRDAR